LIILRYNVINMTNPLMDRKKYNWYVGNQKERRVIDVIISNHPSPLQKWETTFNKKQTYDTIVNVVNDFYIQYGFTVRIITPFGLGASATLPISLISSIFKFLNLLIKTILIRLDGYNEGKFLNRRQQIGLTIMIPDLLKIEDALFLNNSLRQDLIKRLPYINFFISYRFEISKSNINIDLQNNESLSLYERVVRKVDKYLSVGNSSINIRIEKRLVGYSIKLIDK